MIDTPGRDDPLARHAATRAHGRWSRRSTTVSSISTSSGRSIPENFKVKRLSFYAELMWETRKARAKTDGVSIDWIVLRNRLHHMEARNQKRVGEALSELSKRVGFRVITGLSERVIFRELFPSGLTLLDKGHLGDLGISHVAARQELREMVGGLALPPVTARSGAERDAA